MSNIIKSAPSFSASSMDLFRKESSPFSTVLFTGITCTRFTSAVLIVGNNPVAKIRKHTKENKVFTEYTSLLP